MAASPDQSGLPEQEPLAPGSVFGNYVVHECIGQGAMGSVYRAVHALLAKPVALKIMDPSLLGSAEAQQRFLREGQAAAAIKHPNVVDITDVGFLGNTPYLVMELLLGEDLSMRLERGGWLDEQEATSLVIPIVAALAAAHDSGVVHRDLKPSNIFLAQGPDGEVVPKVLDFGISKLSRVLDSRNFGATPFNQLMGSPLYLPPEALEGSGGMTSMSDQYSLGVVLYECLTGKPPFDGDSLFTLMNAISAGAFARPRELRPELSAHIDQTLMRAMDADPARRFAHVRDFGRALLEVSSVRTRMLWGRSFGRTDLSELPMPVPNLMMTERGVPTPPRFEVPNRPKRGRKLMAAIGTLGVLCALGAGLWFGLGAPPTAGSVSRAAPPRSTLALEPAQAASHPLASMPAAAPPVAPSADAAGRAAHPLARRTSRADSTQQAKRVDERAPALRRAEVGQRPAGAARVQLPGARPKQLREAAIEASPKPDDDVDPFALGRKGGVAEPPAAASETMGANESPILD